MVYIHDVTTAVPSHKLGQEKLREIGRKVLRGKVPFLDQALGLFTNAGVENRYLARDVDEIMANHNLGWRNKVYQDTCIELGIEMMGDLLTRNNLKPEEIDLIITTSCTGFMIPALDAYLINHFRMRPDVKRLPLTELGCAAGAMAFSRATDYLKAYPHHKVALLAVELPSLTCRTKDFRVANLVSVALFGDGGAAALMSNEPGPCEVKATTTHFYYDTPEMMGFDLDESGFKIILDKKISNLVLTRFREPLTAFLAAQDLTPEQIQHHVFHPGGRRIMDSLKTVLNLDESRIWASRKVLKEVGNLSSASVFWVLAEVLKNQPEGLGLMAAFGPGFNAELLTLDFHGNNN